MPAMEAPLLLASASPRRRRLIAWLGVPFEVTATDTLEDLASPLASVPPVLARFIAADKARAARDQAGPDAAIVACDTIVLLDRRILGKPSDLTEASGMLRALSGRRHDVITGVALFLSGWPEPRTFAVTTPVQMHDIDEHQERAWLAKGEVLGCAGAYNIESHLASVDAGECYQNVAGLPVCHLFRELGRHGYPGVCSPAGACDASRGTLCALGARLAGGTAVPS